MKEIRLSRNIWHIARSTKKKRSKNHKIKLYILITDFWHGFSGMQFVFTSKKEKNIPNPNSLKAFPN